MIEPDRPRRGSEKKRPGASPTVPGQVESLNQSNEYTASQLISQQMRAASALDRRADWLLFLGRHAAAERLSFQAAALRG